MWGAPLASAEVLTPRAADGFVDSVGVNVHLHYTDRPAYWEFAGYKQMLIDSGIRHVRDGLVQVGREEFYQRHAELADTGIRGTFIASPRRGYNGIEAGKVVAELDRMGAYVVAVESANEWDISADAKTAGGWAMPLAQYHADLRAAVKGSAEHGGLPLLAPSLVKAASHAEAATAYLAVNGRPLVDDIDYGNMHPYPGGRVPSHEVDAKLLDIEPVSGGKPVMATETGYHNALMASGHPGVSEEAAAAYTPRLFLEYFNRGIVRTFDYELIDNFGEAASGGSSGSGEGSTDREAHFGLIAYDPQTRTHAPKPAYFAVQHTLSLLADADGDAVADAASGGQTGAAWEPRPLDVTLAGGGEELSHTLLQKRDGTYYLVLWRDVPLWDTKTGEAMEAEAEAVTITLDATAKGITLYDPTWTAEAVGRLEDAATFVVPVGGTIKVVEFQVDNAVPEPAAFGLLGPMCVLALRRRRRTLKTPGFTLR